MKILQNILLGFIIVFISVSAAFSQSCNPGGPAGTFNFFTSCQTGSSYSLTGNYSLTVGNNKTVVINGNVTINGTLNISLTGSTSTIIIQSPYTLTATNITFSGSATGKQLEVEGPSGKMVVSGTLNFGDLTIEIDGTGSISAGSITGASNSSCVGVSTCPTITATTCNDGSGTFCDTSLPVELVSFTAEQVYSKAELKWSTASQLNFSHFEIERSANGVEWVVLHSIEGEGTTNELLNYSYLDEQPMLGKNYYRLRMVDLDQTFEYSPIENVEVDGDKQLSLSPNPAAEGRTTYHLNFVPQGGTITLYDLTGMELYKARASEESSEIALPSTITAGTYFVRYTDASVSVVARLLVR